MRKKEYNTNLVYNSILTLIAFVAAVLFIITGNYFLNGYDLNVGSVSPQKFVSPRTVVDEISTAKNQAAAEKASQEIKPILKRDNAVAEKINTDINDFFTFVDQSRKERTKIDIPYDVQADSTIPEIPESTPELPKLPIALTDVQIDFLLSMDSVSYNDLKTDVKDILNIVLDQGVQEVDTKILLSIKEAFDKLPRSSDVKNLGYEVVASFIEPNYFIDEDATQKAREDIANKYTVVYILKDQLILDENHIITEEKFELLSSLGLVSKSYLDNIIPACGALIILIAIFMTTYAYIYFCHKELILNKKEATLILTLFVLTLALTWALNDLPYYFMPVLIFTMLVAILIDFRLAIVANVAITLITYLIIYSGAIYVPFYLIAGTGIAILSKFASERANVFFIGIWTGILNVMISIGLEFFLTKNVSTTIWSSAGFALLNGVVSVILSIGSLPMWEAIFGSVTTIKLLDLANPNNALLRRLTIEAPGTYHHSLIVANLSETAAFDINANPNLARVGAYYHDIGKLTSPQYFTENQAGENPHDFLDPIASVNIITSHVTYGLELANAYKLPQMVKDIISQHHGNTMIKYFYYKQIKMVKDDPVNEDEFRYKNPTPQSKEAAIVMLADTVEAAVRSMITDVKSLVEVEVLIRSLVRAKLDDNQLVDSQFTIKDIDTVIESFMRVYKGMYHERIQYPKDEKDLKDIPTPVESTTASKETTARAELEAELSDVEPKADEIGDEIDGHVDK